MSDLPKPIPLIFTNLVLICIALLLGYAVLVKPKDEPEQKQMVVEKRYCPAHHAFLAVDDKIRSDLLITRPGGSTDASVVATSRQPWQIWATYNRLDHDHCVVFDFDKVGGVPDEDGPGFGLKPSVAGSFEVFSIEHETGKACKDLLTDDYKNKVRAGCRSTHEGGWQGSY